MKLIDAKGLDLINQVTQRVDFVCEKHNLLQARCLATSTIIKHVLEKHGLTCHWFPCSYDGYSFEYMTMLNELGRLPENDKEVTHWLERRAKCVSVVANDESIVPVNEVGGSPLRGHMALIIEHDDGGVFLDSTSYQFRRVMPVHGWTLDVPYFQMSLVQPQDVEKVISLESKSLEDVNSNSVSIRFELGCGGLSNYRYTKLEQLERGEELGDMDISRWSYLIKEVLS